MNKILGLRRHLPLLTLGLLLVGCGEPTPDGAAPTGTLSGALTFEGRFSGTQAVPPTGSGASGSVQATLNANHTELTYTVRHSVAAAVGAGLFRGSMGQAGALVTSIDAALDVSGKLAVGPAEVTDLLAGSYYVSVASAAFATGEVRAQLLGVGGAAQAEVAVVLSATLGDQQPPSDQQPAQRGSGTLTFEARSGELSYEIQHSLAAGAALRIGHGAFGSTGQVLLTLPAASGKVTLDAESRLLLQSGLLYLEVEGAGRTLRGQIVADKTLPFSISLEPATLVQTSARGRVLFVLSAQRGTLAFRLQHDAAEVTGASISRGLLGLGGRAVCTLSGGEDGAQGLCEIKTQGGLDAILLSDLLGSQLRVNLTTKTHLLGELQGLLSVPL